MFTRYAKFWRDCFTVANTLWLYAELLRGNGVPTVSVKLGFIRTRKDNSQRVNSFNKQKLDTFCGMRHLSHLSHHLICPVPPIISGTRKATNFKFGRYIHTVHPSKSPLKICEKRECGHIQGRPKFFQYPLLSQERVKLRTSNLAGIFTVFIRPKGF